MSDKLKPCPFCGSVEFELVKTDIGWYLVRCNTCIAEGQAGRTTQQTEQLWNTRPLEDALQAEVDEQNELIESLTVSIEDLVELVQSNMADTCAWCLGREGKHDADCDAVRVLGPRVPRWEGGE